MHGLLKQPGYRLYAPGSPEARALLAEQGLGPADLERALDHLKRAEGTTVRTILGINEDGVFGTGRAGWQPDIPDACREPFVPLLWVKVQELLGRVPRAARRGSSRTARCRAKPRAAPPSTGWPAEASTRSTYPIATDSTPPRPRARRRSLFAAKAAKKPVLTTREHAILAIEDAHAQSC